MGQKSARILLLLLLLALAATFYAGMGRNDPNALPSVFIGKQAPALNPTELPGYAMLTDADLRKGDVVLIPIRVGAGLRLGINAGYMKFSKKQKWLPF